MTENTAGQHKTMASVGVSGEVGTAMMGRLAPGQGVAGSARRRVVHPLVGRRRSSLPPSAVLGRRLAGHPEAGMATAEYAIATIAAVGFAGLLVVVLKSDSVRGLLMSLITSALTIG